MRTLSSRAPRRMCAGGVCEHSSAKQLIAESGLSWKEALRQVEDEVAPEPPSPEKVTRTDRGMVGWSLLAIIVTLLATASVDECGPLFVSLVLALMVAPIVLAVGLFRLAYHPSGWRRGTAIGALMVLVPFVALMTFGMMLALSIGGLTQGC
jgi:hypothetical protein